MRPRLFRAGVVIVLLALLLVGTYFLLKALRGTQVGPGRERSDSPCIAVAQRCVNFQSALVLVREDFGATDVQWVIPHAVAGAGRGR